MMTKDELLSLCVNKLPEKTITVNNGEVTIKALKGSTIATIMSEENMSDRIRMGLREGLKDPILTNREVMQLMDNAFEYASDIFAAIMELSSALGEAEVKEKDELKKN